MQKITFLGITPVSSVSNGLYLLNLPLVSVTRIIYTSEEMSKKFGVRVIHYVRVIYKKYGNFGTCSFIY
jgi:hypothetical protein